VAKSWSYMDNVHTPTYAHVSDYFIGLLVAYMLETKIITGGIFLKKSLLLSTVMMMVQVGLMYSPALHNVYGKIPADYFAHYVIATKLSFSLLFALIFVKLYAQHEQMKQLANDEQNQANQNVDNNNENEQSSESSIFGDDVSISVPKAMVKLSFAGFIISYFFIRYDFFTSRLLFAFDFYNIVKRMIYTVVYSFLLSTSFHLFFLAPFDAVRKSMELKVILNKKKIA